MIFISHHSIQTLYFFIQNLVMEDKTTLLKDTVFKFSLGPEDRDLRDNLKVDIESMGGEIRPHAEKGIVKYIIANPDNLYVSPTTWKRSGRGEMKNQMCIWVNPELIAGIKRSRVILSGSPLGLLIDVDSYVIHNIVDLYNTKNTFNTGSRYRPNLSKRKRSGKVLTIRTKSQKTQHAHVIDFDESNLKDLIFKLLDPWKDEPSLENIEILEFY